MPRKETRDRGQIIPRGDRKYLVRVFTGYNEEGKRVYSSEIVSGTISQANQALTKKLNALDNNSFVAPSKQTLRQYAESWLKWKAGDLSDRTHRDYGDLLKHHVYPRLGNRKLDKIAPQAIRELYVDLAAKLSTRTVRYVHVVFKQCLTQAVIDNLLVRSPAEFISPPKQDRADAESNDANPSEKMKVLSPAQVYLFLEKTLNHRWAALWCVLLTGGLRPQEAFGLKWSDLDGTVIRISRALRLDRKGRAYLAPTKTKKSRRTVKLPASTIVALKAHRTKQAAAILKAGDSYTRQDLIFANSVGGFMEISAVRREWKNILKEIAASDEGKTLSFPDNVKLYGSRHTHATVLLASGVHPKIAQERLGHSSITITMDTYSHVIEGMDEQAVEAFEQAISSRSGTNG